MVKRRILFALVSVLLLAGCASAAQYREDAAVSDLAAEVDGAIESEGLVAMEESYLKNAMQLDPTAFAEYVVKINAKGVNIDEYGIFKAPDEKSVDGVKAAAEDYLKFRIDSWMPEYMPEEYPKLENARVQVFGRYVMYAILSDTRSEAAFAALEAQLKA